MEASSSSSSKECIEFSLSYRGQTYPITLDRDSSIHALYDIIYQRTGVLPMHQKVVAPGALKRAFVSARKENDSSNDDHEDESSLEQLGFGAEYGRRGSIKLMLVGPKEEEVAAVRREEEQGAKANAPRKYHPSMLRNTRPTKTTTPAAFNPFLSLRVHSGTPDSAPEYALVMSRLRQLSTDEAVLHVCRIHNFRVSELTELLPHEHPNLLGLNENMGQRISLRLRTDRYDGLQAYRETRRVLLHELAHNKVNDHPPEFKILNSELNAQVEAFERAKKDGTHTLMGDADVYVPPVDATTEGHTAQTTHVLGGREGIDAEASDPIDVQSRRQRVLEATMKRLEKVEADIERGCGSTTAT